MSDGGQKLSAGLARSASQAVRQARAAGLSVSHAHLRYVHPFPANTETLLRRFKRVVIPEMNNGMLVKIIRGDFLIDAVPVNKIAGQPFKVSEIAAAIRENLPSAN